MPARNVPDQGKPCSSPPLKMRQECHLKLKHRHQTSFEGARCMKCNFNPCQGYMSLFILCRNDLRGDGILDLRSSPFRHSYDPKRGKRSTGTFMLVSWWLSSPANSIYTLLKSWLVGGKQFSFFVWWNREDFVYSSLLLRFYFACCWGIFVFGNLLW